jgi:VWFA-related protein
LPVSRREFVKSAAGLLFSTAILPADDVPTFSTSVNVVNILANVLTKDRQIVSILTKDDFTVAENGRPQIITYFAKQSDLPLTLGLLVDTSMSQRRVLNAERGASLRFLDQVLRENKDHVFLMQFDMNVQVRQGLSASRRELDEALAFVDTPTRRELMNQRGGGTLLYDAVVIASNDTMKAQTGRKALIILSDGVDTGSDNSLPGAIEAAQRADTLIYCIMFSDDNGTEGRGALSRMSRETGGGFFEVTKKQGIEQIFDVIQEELRSQYSLGYVSDQPVRISEFRKIQLTTKQKGLIIQARDKYWAKR